MASRAVASLPAAKHEEAARRRRRLGQLLELALAYRGFTRKELARQLGRDPTKLVPGTGIPKLDYVVGLAGVLDWPVGDVVSYLWSREPHGGDVRGGAFAAIDRSAARACEARRFAAAVDLARAAAASAEPGRRRARALRREAEAWRGRGRYAEAAQALTTALGEPGLPPQVRRAAQAELAEAYYTRWSLIEALAISRDLIDGYRRAGPRSARDRRTQALAWLLAGQTRRRLLSIEPRRTAELATEARRDLEQALLLHRALLISLDDAVLEGPASTCEAALIEVDVELGRRCPADALAYITAGLERARDVTVLPAARLESYGWWCIYGCNVALRHLADAPGFQQHMAILTNKADEIAGVLDHWPLRERVFSMQYARWERSGAMRFDIPRVIDDDDVRIITGTMGRFPAFRATGWKILRTAGVVARD